VLGAIATEITTRLEKNNDNKTEQKGTHYIKETKRGKREKKMDIMKVLLIIMMIMENEMDNKNGLRLIKKYNSQ